VAEVGRGRSRSDRHDWSVPAVPREHARLNGSSAAGATLGPASLIGCCDQGGAARLVDLGSEGFQTVPAAGHQRDRGTVVGEPAGGSGADPVARAGDEGDGPGEVRFYLRNSRRSAVDAGHVRLVVALTRGRRKFVQAVELSGAEFDAVGSGVFFASMPG
jgi:hypothetical protein